MRPQVPFLGQGMLDASGTFFACYCSPWANLDAHMRLQCSEPKEFRYLIGKLLREENRSVIFFVSTWAHSTQINETARNTS